VTSGRGSFEIVEHTADVAVRGVAPDLDELFRVMARGLFSVIADLDTIRSRRERPVDLEAATLEDLLHDWLEELNGLHQVHGELYAAFEPHVEGLTLHAVARGEAIDPGRHHLGTEVKAVTWHDLRVARAGTDYQAYVLLDI
jgi:SHS2 domain-containing protein